MSTVSGILLAAGESRRMGGVNKMMLPVNGQPLLRRTVLTLQASRLDELVVVLGHRADEARAVLQDVDVTLVDNPHYQDGQMSSVHSGLAALVRPCDGVMICLADQPLLTHDDIDALIVCYCERGGSILVPTYEGRRGNPIVIDYAHRDTILGCGRTLGCKRLIEDNPELVTTVAMANDHVVFDLDMLEDYARLQMRLAAAPARRAGAGRAR